MPVMTEERAGAAVPADLKTYMLDDEEVVYSFTHRPTGLVSWAKSLLGFGESQWFVTSKRVVVYGQRAGGFDFQEVPLDRIRSLEYGQTLDWGTVILGLITLPILVGVLILLYAYLRRPQVLNVHVGGSANLSVQITKGDQIDEFLWYLAAQREIEGSNA